MFLQLLQLLKAVPELQSFVSRAWNAQRRPPVAHWLSDVRDNTRMSMLGNIVVPIQACCAMSVLHGLMKAYRSSN